MNQNTGNNLSPVSAIVLSLLDRHPLKAQGKARLFTFTKSSSLPFIII